jgi:hypothetical protein
LIVLERALYLQRTGPEKKSRVKVNKLRFLKF